MEDSLDSIPTDLVDMEELGVSRRLPFIVGILHHGKPAAGRVRFEVALQQSFRIRLLCSVQLGGVEPWSYLATKGGRQSATWRCKYVGG